MKGIKVAARTGPSRPLITTVNHPQTKARLLKNRRKNKQALEKIDLIEQDSPQNEDNQRKVSAFFTQMVASKAQPVA